MFLDASVLVAIFNREPDGEALERRVAAAEGRIYVSPIVMYEATLAVARVAWAQDRDQGLSRSEVIARSGAALAAYLDAIGAVEIQIDAAIGRGAIAVAATYGKAIGHKADLNMGDCFSYACAKSLDLPLLYKGNDFALTDLA